MNAVSALPFKQEVLDKIGVSWRHSGIQRVFFLREKVILDSVYGLLDFHRAYVDLKLGRKLPRKVFHSRTGSGNEVFLYHCLFICADTVLF